MQTIPSSSVINWKMPNCDEEGHILIDFDLENKSKIGEIRETVIPITNPAALARANGNRRRWIKHRNNDNKF